MNELQTALSEAFDQVEADDEPSSQPHDEPAGEPSEVSDGGLPESSEVSAGFGDTGGAEQHPDGGAVPDGEGLPERERHEGNADAAVAPKNLPPAAREEWAAVPDSVKDYISKFDQRMEGMQQKYAADAQRAQAMDQTLQPYQQLFAMNGGAKNVMPGLLQTASVLQMGTPKQKAEMVAGLIQQFSVDIKTLDNMLVGEAPPPEAQAQQQVQTAVQEAVAPYQQQMQQLQQQQAAAAQQQQQKVHADLASFAAANEFYMDVKGDMADLLEMASNRGKEMSLQDAYDKAVQLRPDIAKIVQARQAAQGAGGRRRAASSISGGPGGGGESAAQGSMRDTIESAWQTAGRV